VIYTVRINGTDRSMFPDNWGITRNPFPQIGQARFDHAEQALSKLQEPGQTLATIKETLKDFDQEFVKMVAEAYRPGHVVRLDVSIPNTVLGL